MKTKTTTGLQIIFLALVCILGILPARAQQGNQSIPSSGGVTVVTALPAKCTAGQQFIISSTGQAFTCLAGNIFSPGGFSVFNVKTFGALGDTQQISGCTFTATQTTVTCAASTFVAGDVGKVLYCNVSGGTTKDIVVTAISAFISSSAVTLASGATNSSSANEICAWGHKDTAALQAASAAAVKSAQAILAGQTGFFSSSISPTIYIPSGGYMVSDCPFCIQSAVTDFMSPSIIGSGQATARIFLASDFTPSSLVTTNGGFIVNTNGTGGEFANFSVTGSDGFFDPSSQSPAAVLSFGSSAGYIHDVACAISTNGQACMQWIGSGQNIQHILSTGGGSVSEGTVPCVFTGVSTNEVMSGSYCGNGNRSVLIQNISGLTVAARLVLRDNVFDECASTNAACTRVINSTDIVFENNGIYGGLGSAGNEPLLVDATSDVVLTGNNIGSFGAPTNGSGILMQNGSVVRASMNRFRAFGTGRPVEGVSGSKFVDVGGNFYYQNGSLVSSAAAFSGFTPQASLTHAANTCYVTLSPFATANLCNQFVDQPIQIFRVKAISNQSTTCAAAPVVTITDGTTTITLTITSGTTTWDSGAIASNFASGGTITVSTTGGTCATPPTNFAVTYSYMSIGAN